MNTWLIANGNYTSAHYEITDNEIIGAVGENFIAYHSGGTGGSDVPTISDINNRSIGLEHVNSSGAPNWEVSDATLRNSGRLIADIANRYGLPINRNTIKLHREITATACPGGLDIDKLIQYALEASGNGGNIAGSPAPAPVPNVDDSDAIKEFKKIGNQFTLYKPFKVDEVKNIYGMWQAISYEMAGGEGDWYNNGIPLALVHRTDGKDNNNVTPGAMIAFDDGYNYGTIDEYDAPTNGAYITWGGNYGGTWFSADALLSH